MKERLTRLKTIRKLIKNYRIESQDTLLAYLEKEGYEVTQATLSRDLKLLKVGKVSDGSTGYVYSLTGEEERQESEQIYIQDFLRGYVSIDWSGNIVVIKTYPGHANTVSSALDNLNMDELLGTVAGDNCLFACLRQGVTGNQFKRNTKAERTEFLEMGRNSSWIFRISGIIFFVANMITVVEMMQVNTSTYMYIINEGQVVWNIFFLFTAILYTTSFMLAIISSGTAALFGGKTNYTQSV